MDGNSKMEALPTPVGETVGTPVAKGMERVLFSVAAAIDRGELSPAFLALGCGLGAGVVITALRGGTVSFLQGMVKLEQSS